MGQSMGVQAPTLDELKSRPCTPEELQAALVHLIELHNGLHRKLDRLLQNGQILSETDALMNTPYKL